MKVVNKEIKECTLDGKENMVLFLEYTHRGTKGEILVKDYDDKFYDVILKQLKLKVRTAYNSRNIKKEV